MAELGCCDGCGGTGKVSDPDTNGVCADCYGTRHCHAGPCIDDQVCAECPADSPTYVPCREHPHADIRIATPEDRVASRQAAERVGHTFKDTVYCVRGCGRPAHHEAIAGLTSDGVEVVELHCGDEDCECRCFKDHLWMCLDGQAYGPCSSENCDGACIWEGPCRCACHKKEDEA